MNVYIQLYRSNGGGELLRWRAVVSAAGNQLTESNAKQLFELFDRAVNLLFDLVTTMSASCLIWRSQGNAA